MRRSIQESCSRLGIDRLDIALVHDPDDHFAEAISEALPALCDLRAEGTVGAIGVGMNQAGMLVRFVREAELDCVLVAGRWSLLDRSVGRGIASFVYGAPSRASSSAGCSTRASSPTPVPARSYDYSPAGPELFAAARRLREICTRYGVPLRVAALHFPLRHPAVSAIVVGARSPDEVITDLADLDRTVPDELWAELAAG